MKYLCYSEHLGIWKPAFLVLLLSGWALLLPLFGSWDGAFERLLSGGARRKQADVSSHVCLVLFRKSCFSRILWPLGLQPYWLIELSSYR